MYSIDTIRAMFPDSITYLESIPSEERKPLANLRSHRQFFHEPNAVHIPSNSSLRQRDKYPEIHIQRTTNSYFSK